MSIRAITENLWVLLGVGIWVAQALIRRKRREARQHQREMPPFEVKDVLPSFEADDNVDPWDEMPEEATQFVEEPEPKRSPKPAAARVTEEPEPPHHEAHHREDRPPHRRLIIPCDTDSLRQAIILSEILGKPKAHRGGSAGHRRRALG